jgi:hypothetical protein
MIYVPMIRYEVQHGARLAKSGTSRESLESVILSEAKDIRG